MPCFDLGLGVYDDEFTGIGGNTGGPFLVEAPEGKKFVSASWDLCTTSSGVDSCGDNSNAQGIIHHKPNSDLTEWTFWFVRTGSGGLTLKLKVRMVTIDA